jgi:large subunit ribosomal protein L29
MKAAGFRDRTTSELEQLEAESRRELWKARFDNYTHQLDDTSKIERLRRNIARIKTILNERQRTEQAAQTKES